MSDNEDDTTVVGSIPLGQGTQVFMQGVVAAQKVRDAHDAVDVPNHRARLALFWFYVGAIAVAEYQLTEQEDLSLFIAGATTRCPGDPEQPE